MTAVDPRRSIPPMINHVVLTGTVRGEPQKDRSPKGDSVTIFQIEFPVVNPAHPQELWTSASCLVEVPLRRDPRELAFMADGVEVLVSGQLSERSMVEGGETRRRSVVVATLLKRGPASTQGPS